MQNLGKELRASTTGSRDKQLSQGAHSHKPVAAFDGWPVKREHLSNTVASKTHQKTVGKTSEKLSDELSDLGDKLPPATRTTV